MAMTARFHVWDDETGNVVATAETRGSALAFLRDMLAQNGEAGVRDLAILEYRDDGSDPVTVIEGTEFLAGLPVRA